VGVVLLLFFKKLNVGPILNAMDDLFLQA